MSELRGPDGVPPSEYSLEFLQGMLNRMAMSYFKYGAVADAYPIHVDAVDSLMKRLRKYRETGNTEWLMDVANFAMIEFMHPAHDNAHFEAMDSSSSPGRSVTHRRPQDTNRDLSGR